MYELLHNFWFLLFLSTTAIGVAGTITHAWQKVCSAEAEVRLKKAMLERGLTVAEMEALLQPAPLSEDQIVEKLGQVLAEKDASKETIQRVMGAFNASDSPGKRTLSYALFGLCNGSDPSDEQIFAVLAGLSRPPEEGGKWQNPEPKLALPATGTDGKGDVHAIRAAP